MPEAKNCWQRLEEVRARKEEYVKGIADLNRQELKLILECETYLRAGNITSITPRESQLLYFLVDDPTLQLKEIADKMNISTRTVKFHVSSLLAKYDVKSRTELILKASPRYGFMSTLLSKEEKACIES